MAKIEGFDGVGPEGEGLYEKYRVFREPQFDDARNPVEEHPVPMVATFATPIEDSDKMLASQISEVTDFVFVLKPDSDHHARVALAAYAWSVSQDDQALYRDLMDVLKGFDD